MNSKGRHFLEITYPSEITADPAPCHLRVHLLIPSSHIGEWDTDRLERFRTAVAALQAILDEPLSETNS